MYGLDVPTTYVLVPEGHYLSAPMIARGEPTLQGKFPWVLEQIDYSHSVAEPWGETHLAQYPDHSVTDL